MKASYTALEKEFSDVCKPNYLKTIEFPDDLFQGWYPIVRTVLEAARKEGLTISLIKEKYANLRVHADRHNEKFSAICNFACDLSLNTCSTCGKYGQLRFRGGWYITGCGNCFPDWNIKTNV